jgi:hypothetical protein
MKRRSPSPPVGFYAQNLYSPHPESSALGEHYGLVIERDLLAFAICLL